MRCDHRRLERNRGGHPGQHQAVPGGPSHRTPQLPDGADPCCGRRRRALIADLTLESEIVGSIAGGIPSQGVAICSATKAFLDAFITSLHRELHGSPLHASVIRPGRVATEFFEAAAGRPAGGNIPAERFAIRAVRVAVAIWNVLKRPRRAVYVPAALGLVPWFEATIGWLMDLLGPPDLRARRARA